MGRPLNQRRIIRPRHMRLCVIRGLCGRGRGVSRAPRSPAGHHRHLSRFHPAESEIPNYIAFVGPGDKDAGYHMGKALLAALKPGPDGKKVIGVVNGTPGTSVAIDRRKGLAQAIEEEGADKVTIAGEVQGNFTRDEAMTAFQSLYQGHPEIKSVFSANDPMAMGVIAALERAGKKPGKDVISTAPTSLQ